MPNKRKSKVCDDDNQKQASVECELIGFSEVEVL